MSRAEKRAEAQARRQALQTGYWAEMEKIIKAEPTGSGVSFKSVWGKFCAQANLPKVLNDQMQAQELLIFRKDFVVFWKETFLKQEEALRSDETIQEAGGDG